MFPFLLRRGWRGLPPSGSESCGFRRRQESVRGPIAEAAIWVPPIAGDGRKLKATPASRRELGLRLLFRALCGGEVVLYALNRRGSCRRGERRPLTLTERGALLRGSLQRIEG